MIQFTHIVQDELGIHARPAGILVKTAAAYQSQVTIAANGKNADAKKIFAVMGLGAKKGAELSITVDGSDEAAASEAFKAFLKENL